MSTGKEDIAESSDSDDGFEVLDPEPEQENDIVKSQTDYSNAGTIIFCHMNDEYNSLREVKCQYIRPNGWCEQEKDEIAIFQVGWINIEEALARLPVDQTTPKGFPLGSLNLTDLSFSENFAESPGSASHFQCCYLRDGVLLGASTPFSIRDIKGVGRVPLMGDSPVFLPKRMWPVDEGPTVAPSTTTNNSVFETSAVRLPSLMNQFSSPPFAFSGNKVVPKKPQEPWEMTLSASFSDFDAVMRDFERWKREEGPQPKEPTKKPEIEMKEKETFQESEDLQKKLEIAMKEIETLKGKLIMSGTFQVQLLSDVKNINAELMMVKETLSAKETYIVELEEQLQDARSQLRIVKEELLSKESNEDRLKKGILLLEDEARRAAERLCVYDMSFHDLQKQLKSSEAEMMTFKEELLVKETENDVLEKQLQDSEAELKPIKEKLLQKEIDNDRLQIEVRDLKAELEKVKELSVRNINKCELENQQQDVEAELEQVKESLAEKERHNEMLRNELDAFVEELWATQANTSEVTEKLREKEAELRTVKEELSQRETEFTIITKELSKSESDRMALDEKLQETASSLAVVMNDLQLAKKGLLSVAEKDKKSLEWMKQMQSSNDEMSTLGKQLEKGVHFYKRKSERIAASLDCLQLHLEQRESALGEQVAHLKSQNESLLDEAKLYKSKLGDTIIDLTNTRREVDNLKEQCAKHVEEFNSMEKDKHDLIKRVNVLTEEVQNDSQNDVLVQEYLKKTEELVVAKKQMENFQIELTRLNAQRTSLQKELLEARREVGPCGKPCCNPDNTPGCEHQERLMESILEALEQSNQKIELLEKEVEQEKKRAQDLDEKLQTAAGKHRTLYMEKITLESRLKELLE